MFTVYCDGIPFYSSSMFDSGLVLTSAKISYEVNRAGSFEFVIPCTNPQYDIFKKLKSIITVEEDGIEIWRGRVLDSTTDFYKNKDILCEGELAFLNDGLVRPYNWGDGKSVRDALTYYMQYYTDNCTTERMIRLGNITAVDPDNTIIFVTSDGEYKIILDAILELVDSLGGQVVVRRLNGVSYLDYVPNPNGSSNQTIEFGKNMLDFEEYIDASDVYTYLLPLGKKDENGNRLTINSVNDGQEAISSAEGFNLFGRIERTLTWDNISDPSQLKAEAEKTLAEAIKSSVSMSIKAVDMRYLGASPDRIKIGSNVRVVSVPHGIDTNFICSAMSIDLLNPANNDYTLGYSATTLSGLQSSTSSVASSAINKSQSAIDSVNQVSNDLGSGNYVMSSEFNSFKSEVEQNFNNYTGKNEFEGFKSEVESNFANYTSSETFNEFKAETEQSFTDIQDFNAETYATIQSLQELEERIAKLEENGGTSNE